MTIETEDDVAALKRIGRIVSYVLQKMLDAAEPGMTTLELDSLGEQFLKDTVHDQRPGSHTTSQAQPASASTRKLHTASQVIE